MALDLFVFAGVIRMCGCLLALRFGSFVLVDLCLLSVVLLFC